MDPLRNLSGRFLLFVRCLFFVLYINLKFLLGVPQLELIWIHWVPPLLPLVTFQRPGARSAPRSPVRILTLSPQVWVWGRLLCSFVLRWRLKGWGLRAGLWVVITTGRRLKDWGLRVGMRVVITPSLGAGSRSRARSRARLGLRVIITPGLQHFRWWRLLCTLGTGSPWVSHESAGKHSPGQQPHMYVLRWLMQPKFKQCFKSVDSLSRRVKHLSPIIHHNDTIYSPYIVYLQRGNNKGATRSRRKGGKKICRKYIQWKAQYEV